jgi:Tol biopolymer transport system component
MKRLSMWVAFTAVALLAAAASASSTARVFAGSIPAAKRNGDILYVGAQKPYRVLYLIRPDGTHRRLIPGTRNAWFPAWSSDGKWIVFGRSAAPGSLCTRLYVIRSDGTHARRLTGVGACYRDPVWSPDRQRIAFSKQGALGKDSIWTMKIDGSGLRMLTDDGDNPAWSPDGGTIAFERGLIAPAIWLMDGNGANQRRLTMPAQRLTHSERDLQPDWSPNGTRIAFTRWHDDNSTKTYVSDVFTIRSDGTGLRVLTRPHARGSMPAWSPDGTRIVFLGGDPARDSTTGLYVMNADGSGQKRLAKGESDWPDWRAR